MDYFLLDAKTGELRTARPLDREALPDATGIIVLTVRVSIFVFFFSWKMEKKNQIDLKHEYTWHLISHSRLVNWLMANRATTIQPLL